MAAPVGAEEYVNIIAEIGINHNGDMDLCKKLIMVEDRGRGLREAQWVGCHFVTFLPRRRRSSRGPFQKISIFLIWA